MIAPRTCRGFRGPPVRASIPGRCRKPLLACAVFATVGFGHLDQSFPVPVEHQYPLIAKILTFDRNLHQRSGAELVMGVIHQPGYPPSLATLRELERVVSESPIKSVEGMPVRVVAVPLRDPRTLEAELLSLGVNVAYLAPLRAVDVRAVVAASHAAGALTVTGVPDYVGMGVSVGLGLQSDRPRILINLPASRRDGADFAAGLLTLADVIR